MKIQPLQNNSAVQPAFNGIHVIDTDVQKLLLTSLNPKQLETLSELIKKQQDNSVHILLGSKNGNRLEANLMCAYRLQDFKTKYKQRLFFESKFNFIKRIVDVAEQYKKQIQNLDVHRLQWNYTQLPEWITKML